MTYMQRWQEHVARLRNGGMVILLMLLVITVFVLPLVVTSSSVIDRVAQDVLLSAILVSGLVAAADGTKGLAWFALAMLAAIVVRWMGWLSQKGVGLVIFDEVGLLSLTLLGALLGTRVFGAGTVTRNRIGGAVALYMLVGLVWADAYQLVSMVVPDSFAGISAHDGPIDRFTWVYFSFVTLTTVGYGDIMPLSRAARSLANLEALIGQLYPAIVLARLVSLRVAGSGSGSNNT
jgi:hypothetical protein